GDKETFRKLVEEAHKHGIRIMLDAVFNHIGKNSKQWQDVLETGRNRATKTGSISTLSRSAKAKTGTLTGRIRSHL
ncbi:alpha-amylase family glycosyl hydrolase, partial [Roseburia faecis]|uniref:alpha-amylase family glycosyl hydrolase n=1 Tax=Roseburia faecis TaxID=301302 RepID=UPI002ED67F14